MAFTLYALLKAALLVVNALAVLNEKRFLSKFGLTPAPPPAPMDGFGAPPSGSESLKTQASGLLFTLRYIQVPLIAANALIMGVDLLFG